MADAESADGERPSFTTFWKRVKQKEKSEAGDQHKKKGKKSASPSSTAELQQEQEQEQEQDEAGEEDQDPGEFPDGALPLLSPCPCSPRFMLDLVRRILANDSIFACPKTGFVGKRRALERQEGSWTAQETSIGHVHSNSNAESGALSLFNDYRRTSSQCYGHSKRGSIVEQGVACRLNLPPLSPAVRSPEQVLRDLE
ncbi:hypothetical protein THARTR1_09993 [Trichoderma harzianum]|uniref:Uncharacterized protein n=1 Tax=Trichoderma harzianum TaxID=5544 RepID=A0A2K0TUS0_TRIHA|nr:hypothetical protein THARTR1_09993 [Trichoderma harzianum]